MTEFFSEINNFFYAVFDGFLFPLMTDRELKIFYFLLPFLLSIVATLIVEFFRILVKQVKK